MKTTKKKKEFYMGPAMSFLLLCPMFLLMLPTVVFMFLSMFPTLVSLLSGYKGNLKYKWLCVGGTNFAGALYYLFQMWFEDATVSTAVFLFLKVDTIFVTYGAAAVGYAIYKIIPAFIINFQLMADQHRLSNLRNMQKKLIEQWGTEVSENPEMN